MDEVVIGFPNLNIEHRRRTNVFGHKPAQSATQGESETPANVYWVRGRTRQERPREARKVNEAIVKRSANESDFILLMT